jgi:uncharacterized membrane protein YeiB
MTPVKQVLTLIDMTTAIDATSIEIEIGPEATESLIPKPSKKRRITGLDLARSIALLGMLYAHFGTAGVGSTDGWQAQVAHFTNGRAMPLFVTLSGCGLTFLLLRSKRPWREMIGRSALLLLVGLYFELAVPIAVILPSYAAYFLLAIPFRKLATKWLLPSALGFIVVGTLTNMFLNEHLPNTTDLISTGSDDFGALYQLAHPLELLSSMFFNGVYPVFPSFAFVLLGMWITRQDLASKKLRLGLIAAGALVAVVGYGAGFATENQRSTPGLDPAEELMVQAEQAGIDPNELVDAQSAQLGKTREATIGLIAKQYGIDPSDLVATLGGLGANAAVASASDPDGWDLLNEDGHSNMPAWMLGASGLSAFVIGLSLVVADRARRVTMPLVALGQMALTAYVFHLALFRWPMQNWPYGFSPTEALALTLGGWLAAAAFALVWKLKLAHGPLEYLLRLAGQATSGDLRRRSISDSAIESTVV